VKTIALFITTPIALLAILMVVFQRAENPTSEYDTYADLETSGLIAGWLPDYLPASAVNIKVRRQMDTSSVWASFEYQVGDIEPVEEACKLIAETQFRKKFLCPPHEERTSTMLLRNDGQAYYSSYTDSI